MGPALKNISSARRLGITVFVFCVLAFSGCSSQKTGQPTAGGGSRDNGIATDNATVANATVANATIDNATIDNSAIDKASDSTVLFRINGSPVTASEFRIFITTIGRGEDRPKAASLPSMADALINNRLLAGLAIKEGIDKLPQVRSKLEARTNGLWGDVLWKHTNLASFKMSDKEVLAQAPPFEELISLQQLLVETPETAARLRKLAAAGESFDNIIITHSKGLTAKNAGKVGYVKRGTSMYDPKALDSLFKLKVGELSPVIHSEIGYSVFKVVDRMTPERQRVDWFKEKRNQVIAEKAKTKWEAYKAKLSRKHKVVLNQKVVDAYMEARAKKKPLEPFRDKVAFRIDDVAFYVGDLIDPSATGVIHGEGTLEVIANKRVDQFAIASEVRRLGLKEKEPGVALQEKLVREDLLAREYINHRCRDLTVTAPELKAQYDKNRARYEVGRSIDVSLIETRSADRVEKIYAALAKGTPFAEVADEWSDNHKFKGGHLGLVPETSINPMFAEIRKIPVGEYGKTPVRVKAKDKKRGEIDLFIIGRVNGFKEKSVTPFDQVDKNTLEKSIMATKREAVVKAVFAEIRKSNKASFTPEYNRFVEKFVRMSSTEGRSK